MKKSIKNSILGYESSVHQLTNTFLREYFCDKDIRIKDLETFWIGDEVGGVLAVNDHYWNLNDIVTALRLNISSDDLFGWYDHIVEGELPHVNLKNYVKLKHDKLKSIKSE